jgi:mRNA-degrading endonuclease RelE of RelBE toxin-antitoxin system
MKRKKETLKRRSNKGISLNKLNRKSTKRIRISRYSLVYKWDEAAEVVTSPIYAG